LKGKESVPQLPILVERAGKPCFSVESEKGRERLALSHNKVGNSMERLTLPLRISWKGEGKA
jgi:hypothetical protein